jgi:shikimate dehydrogenase
VPTSPYSTDGKGFINWEVKYQIPEGTDLAVSATSIGLYPATQSQVPVDMATAGSGMIVCDVIPNPAPCALNT